MPSIELRGVERAIGSFRLGPLDLTFPDRGIVGLVGANGAGKSTMLRLLATVDAPDSGHLALDGNAIKGRRDRTSFRRSLGYVPQDVALPRRARCRDFLFHMAWLKEIPSSKRSAEVDSALEAVELSDRRDDQIGSLSGGMQRRIALAQALLGGPSLLVLDEPTVGLDPQQRVTFRTLVRNAAQDSPVILATHLTEDVRAIAAELVVLSDGQFLFRGSVAELEARGGAEDLGDTDLEKGLSALLRDGDPKRRATP